MDKSAKTLALVVIGIVLWGTAVLQRIAESLFLHGISEAKMTSLERRLARLVGNSRVVVSQVWKAFMAQVLASGRERKVRFVLDCTPLDERACIVSLGLTFSCTRAAGGLVRDGSPREVGSGTMGDCWSLA